MQILDGDRLIVSQVSAKQDQQLCSDEIRERAVGRADTEGLFQSVDTGRMAEARAQVHIVGAQHARQFLKSVIGLVGESARGGEEPHALGGNIFHLRSDAVERLLPAHAHEAVAAALQHHGIRNASELVQLFIRHGSQTSNVGEAFVCRRRHGVQAQQIQARHAQMRA